MAEEAELSSIQQIRREHKYCSVCGKRTEEIFEPDGYDPETGRECYVVRITCPQNRKRIKGFSEPHDHIYLYRGLRP